MGVWTKGGKSGYVTGNIWCFPENQIPEYMLCRFNGIKASLYNGPYWCNPFNSQLWLKKMSIGWTWFGTCHTLYDGSPIEWEVRYDLNIYQHKVQLGMIHQGSGTGMFAAYWQAIGSCWYDNQYVPPYADFYGGTANIQWLPKNFEYDGLNYQAEDLAGVRQGKTLIEMYGVNDETEQFRVARRADHTRLRIKKSNPEMEQS